MDNPWELYSGHPRFEEASQALNRAWEEAKRLAPELPSTARAYRAEKHVYVEMEKWANAGACDTEPRAHLRYLIRNHYGCEGGWL